MRGHLGHEAAHQVAGDVVDTVVVVAELRVFALDLEVDGNALLVADGTDLGVLDGRQRIRCHRQARHAAGHRPLHVTIMQRHERSLVRVLVVHVVDDVERRDVLGGQPVHEAVHPCHDSVVVQHLAGNRLGPGTDLHATGLVHAAVDGVQQRLGQVGAGTEELHLLADDHRADAAGNGIVVAVEVRAHQVVVLVLDGRGVDGDLGAEVLECLGQLLGPQHRDVGLRRRAHVVERVQEAEAVLRDQRAAVQAHAANRFGGPDRVARKELVVFRRAQEAHHPQFHDQVVDEFLRFHFGQRAVVQVTLNVDVQEGGHPAERHGRAVLRLHGSQVGEIGPLHGLAGIAGRAGNVETVAGGHFLHLAQRLVLLVDFLAAADGLFQVAASFQIGLQRVELLDLVFHQAVDAVECHATIVANDAAPAIGVRQASQHAGLAAATDIGRIHVEDALVVGLAVLGEGLDHRLGQRGLVDAAGVLHHLQAAEGHDGALEGFVSLQAHHLFQRPVNVAGGVAGDAGDRLGVDLVGGVGLVLDLDALHHLAPQLRGGLGGRRQETAVPGIGGVVALDEVTNVDRLFPGTGLEIGPGFGVCIFGGQHIELLFP